MYVRQFPTSCWKGWDDPATKHVGGDQRTNGHFLIEYRHSTNSGDRHCRQDRQGQSQMHEHVGLTAAAHGLLDRAGVALLPEAVHRFLQRQRLDRGTAADQLRRDGIPVEAGPPLLGAGPVHDPSGIPGQDDEKRKDGQQYPAHRCSDDEDGDGEEEGERQVGDKHRRQAREGVAHGIRIPEKRLPVCCRAAFQQRQGCRGDSAIEGAGQPDIDLDSGGPEQLRPPLPQQEVECDCDDHADHQALKCRNTAVKHHAIIDLKHEYRDSYGQQIDDE